MPEDQIPFLLEFLEPADPIPAPEERYDPDAQCNPLPPTVAATQRTISMQNRTSGYNLITAYEDPDDEFITRSD